MGNIILAVFLLLAGCSRTHVNIPPNALADPILNPSIEKGLIHQLDFPIISFALIFIIALMLIKAHNRRMSRLDEEDLKALTFVQDVIGGILKKHGEGAEE